MLDRRLSAELEEEMNTPPDTTTWWTNRRRHSYLSMFGLFCLIFVASLGDDKQLAAVLPLYQTLAWVFGAIILTYVGAATIEDVVKLRGMK
jgi:peptidoglycan/LPS O-acetylase OafA/YrhL